MEAAFAEMPLALFTTLSSIGAGAFVALAAAFLTGKFSDNELRKIDKLTLIPFLVVVVGFIAAFFHLAAPLNAFGVFAGVGSSPLSNELVAGVAFGIVALIYTALSVAGKLSAGSRRGFSVVVAVLAVIFAIFMGLAYMMNTIPSWDTPLVPVQMVGFLLAGGAALGSYVICQAGAGKSLSAGSAASALIVLAVAGAVLAIAGLAGQLGAVSGMSNPLASGADLVGDVMPLAAGGLVLVAASAALVVGAVRAKQTVALSGVAVAVALVGILLARLAFYGVQLSVGL